MLSFGRSTKLHYGMMKRSYRKAIRLAQKGEVYVNSSKIILTERILINIDILYAHGDELKWRELKRNMCGNPDNYTVISTIGI